VTTSIFKYWVPHGCMVAGPHGPGFHLVGILETNAVMPFQNFFSDKVSVNYVVCWWVTESVFMNRLSHGLYGNRTWQSQAFPMEILEEMLTQKLLTHNTGAKAQYLEWNCHHKSRATAPSFG